MPTKPFKISAKNLGSLALPNACFRCFWIKTHLKLPYQIFPGIFSSIDSYTKKAIGSYFQKYNCLPDSLSSVGRVKEIFPFYHHTKFSYCDEDTGVILSGIPDDIFQGDDGSLIIVDYKTSRFTEYQDKLFPTYQVQLNGYAKIAQEMDLGKVTALYLIYFEPKTDIEENDIDNLINDNGFLMNFEAKILPVALNLGSIPPLLKRAKDIYDLESPPEGWNGCKECEKLDEMIRSLR